MDEMRSAYKLDHKTSKCETTREQHMYEGNNIKIMWKELWKCEPDRTGSRYGTLAGFGENGNEFSGSIDTANTDQWNTYQMI